MIEQKKKTSYDIFVQTIKGLASSQGFYSRMYTNLCDMSDEERNELRDTINKEHNFKDSLDVIMWLEG